VNSSPGNRVATFAVSTTSLRARADVHYAALAEPVEARLAQAKFDLWPVARLATRLQYGSSKRAESEPVGVPIIRMPNIQDDRLDLTSLKYVDESELPTYRLAQGDILINRTNGSRDLVGKCAVFDQEGDWVFASYLIRLQADAAVVDPHFLAAYLSTDVGRLQMLRFSRQILMANINTEELRQVLVPVPPLRVQKQLLDPLRRAMDERDTAYAAARDLAADIGSTVMAELGLASPVDLMALTRYSARRSQLAGSRLDALYHHPARLSALSAMTSANVGTASLREVASIVRDRVEDCDDDYVGLADVAPMSGTRAEKDEVTTARAGSRFQVRDVLYSRLRPYLNKVWMADRSGCCSTEFRVLRPFDATDAEYIALALLAPLSVMQAVFASSGNTHPRVADDDLLRLTLPWPDVALRQTIVEAAHRIRAEAARLTSEADEAWSGAKAAFATALFH
jgi:type I restriction enzyme, S subunit